MRGTGRKGDAAPSPPRPAVDVAETPELPRRGGRGGGSAVEGQRRRAVGGRASEGCSAGTTAGDLGGSHFEVIDFVSLKPLLSAPPAPGPPPAPLPPPLPSVPGPGPGSLLF